MTVYKLRKDMRQNNQQQSTPDLISFTADQYVSTHTAPFTWGCSVRSSRDYTPASHWKGKSGERRDGSVCQITAPLHFGDI